MVLVKYLVPRLVWPIAFVGRSTHDSAKGKWPARSCTKKTHYSSNHLILTSSFLFCSTTLYLYLITCVASSMRLHICQTSPCQSAGVTCSFQYIYIYIYTHYILHSCFPHHDASNNDTVMYSTNKLHIDTCIPIIYIYIYT